MEKQHIVGEFGYFQKGKGHLTPITNSSTATQCLHTLRHPPSSSTRPLPLHQDRQKERDPHIGLLTFIPLTIIKASTKKYMDINVCSFSHMLVEGELLGKRGLISNRALTWNV